MSVMVWGKGKGRFISIWSHERINRSRSKVSPDDAIRKYLILCYVQYIYWKMIEIWYLYPKRSNEQTFFSRQIRFPPDFVTGHNLPSAVINLVSFERKKIPADCSALGNLNFAYRSNASLSLSFYGHHLWPGGYKVDGYSLVFPPLFSATLALIFLRRQLTDFSPSRSHSWQEEENPASGWAIVWLTFALNVNDDLFAREIILRQKQWRERGESNNK